MYYAVHCVLHCVLYCVLCCVLHLRGALRAALHHHTPHRHGPQARNLALRQRQLYGAVDAVLYLSAADRAAEQRLMPTPAPVVRLLRLPAEVGLLPGGTWAAANASSSPLPQAPPAPPPLPLPPPTPLPLPPPTPTAPLTPTPTPTPPISPALATAHHLGFVGDGRTATNYLGLQRFLREGWPELRRRWPLARLRVAGRAPSGHVAGARGTDEPSDANCSAGRPHCGWCWGTPCAADPAGCGVDTLGYLPTAQLLHEAATWRLLLVPVFATTGANTKVLLGLQLGLPIVSTPAAAAPFGLHSAEDGASLGETPTLLAAAAAALLADGAARARLGAAAARRFEGLLRSNAVRATKGVQRGAQ